ncbi:MULTISPECIES: chorismate pyruvate-lyase family protein [unclassified Paenibacillus]|uniref:chorismate pyruvate-lyase family protein n=1 Tax=unclassified Paenibacillus TaxID=185978 RepID=UPI001C124EFC|nr:MULTISPECIES: chorismate pyruvate-lyase family protein [unclassified Paenibacillus]MBU5440425.1 DUF98 domain-containing protein [Paenibacillus sp. MSJ-34]CAH0119654.1 hypothetical protein PAE9249_02159 [Paenibacillus sp. CECT 9249]
MNGILDKLSPYGRLLLYTKSSMTDLLELYYDSQVKVNVVNQVTGHVPEKVQHLLSSKADFDSAGNVAVREVDIYVAGNDRTPVLHAISLVYLDNLPAEAVQDLNDSQLPIGRVIDKYKLETIRDILETGVAGSESLNSHFRSTSELLFFKKYSIIHRSKPIFLIIEFFPCQELVEIA